MKRKIIDLNKTYIRLILYILSGLLIGTIILVTMPLWHSQIKNMSIVDQWSTTIDSEAKTFARKNNIRLLRIYAYTGDNGMVGVQAFVNDPAQENDIKQFIKAHNPPRPIFWTVEYAGKPRKKYYRTDTDLRPIK